MFDVKCKIFMVKVSYHQKPYRRMMMHIWGGEVTASPSMETQCGRAILEKDPDCPGSLGIAISEAVEAAVTQEGVRYTLGSVLNHVLLHQTVIGLEAEKQMQLAEDYPDVVIGCVGGGSNFAGLAFPFLRHKLAGREIRFVACEPHSCPSMSRGQYRYDYGDTAKLTPLMKMHTLGHSFMPPGIHAGGLRYHGMAPMVSLAKDLGLIEAEAFHQIECFEAAQLFAATEGIIPAPESFARHSRRDRRGPPLQGDRQGEVHPLQPQRSRPVRHGLLREVLRRPPGGLRLSAGEDRGRPGRAAGGVREDCPATRSGAQ